MASDAGRVLTVPGTTRQRWARRFRRVAWLTVALVTVGLAWRIVRYAMDFPLWGDEASIVLSLMDRDFASMIRAPLENHQIAPLGFLWVELAVVRLLGFSEYAMRLPALASSLLSLVIFWRLSRSILNRRAAMLAVAILAAAYYPVRHGNEVKPYATDLLVSVILMSLAWHAAQRPRSTGRWAALIVASVMGVWISYPAAFVVGGVWAYLAWTVVATRSGKGLVGLAVMGVLATSSFYCMYVTFARPHALASPHYFQNESWSMAFPPIDRPWRLPWWLLDIHAGNVMAYPVGGKHFGSAATLLLVIAGVASLWQGKRRDLLVLLLAPAAMTLLAAALRMYPYGGTARTSLHLAPGFCAMAGVGLCAVLRACLPWRRVAAGIRLAAVLIGMIAVAGMMADIFRPYKVVANKQNRDAVRSLAGQTLASDRWIMANSPSGAPCAPELSGSDSDAFRVYVTHLSPAPVIWAPRPEEIAPHEGRTWLLYYSDPKLGDANQDARADAYVRRLTECCGAPSRQSFVLHQPDKRLAPSVISAYLFPERSE